MNPVFKLLQSLPTNGWTTAIGGIALVMYAVGGLLTGQIDMDQFVLFAGNGLGILGLGSKAEKNLPQ